MVVGLIRSARVRSYEPCGVVGGGPSAGGSESALDFSSV